MLVDRLSGTASPYTQPPAYYASLLAHGLLLLLPLAGLGLDRLMRRWREPASAALLVACGGVVGLSAVWIKSAGYVFGLLPARAAAAAVGVMAIAAGEARPGFCTGALALVSLPPMVRAFGGEPAPSVVWMGAWGAMLAGLVAARVRPGWARAAAV